MAVAITAYKAYGNPIDQGIVKRFEYTIQMNITNAAADNDADVGDTGGAFWTSAIAHATYGDYATNLLAILKDVQAKASDGDFSCEVLKTGYVRVAGATSGATEYQVAAFTNHVPEILFHASSAPTAWNLKLKFLLNEGEWPVKDAKEGTII